MGDFSVKRRMLWLLMYLAASVFPALVSAADSTFVGKFQKTTTDSIQAQHGNDPPETFKIDPEFSSELTNKAHLEQGQEITVYYVVKDGKKQATAIKLGEVLWHQRECSREDCACTNFKCQPSCKCKPK